jgi:hypothetical protein
MEIHINPHAWFERTDYRIGLHRHSHTPRPRYVSPTRIFLAKQVGPANNLTLRQGPLEPLVPQFREADDCIRGYLSRVDSFQRK